MRFANGGKGHVTFASLKAQHTAPCQFIRYLCVSLISSFAFSVVVHPCMVMLGCNLGTRCHALRPWLFGRWSYAGNAGSSFTSIILTAEQLLQILVQLLSLEDRHVLDNFFWSLAEHQYVCHTLGGSFGLQGGNAIALWLTGSTLVGLTLVCAIEGLLCVLLRLPSWVRTHPPQRDSRDCCHEQPNQRGQIAPSEL